MDQLYGKRVCGNRKHGRQGENAEMPGHDELQKA
jgi:hypothetical protein